MAWNLVVSKNSKSLQSGGSGALPAAKKIGFPAPNQAALPRHRHTRNLNLTCSPFSAFFREFSHMLVANRGRAYDGKLKKLGMMPEPFVFFFGRTSTIKQKRLKAVEVQELLFFSNLPFTLSTNRRASTVKDDKMLTSKRLYSRTRPPRDRRIDRGPVAPAPAIPRPPGSSVRDKCPRSQLWIRGSNFGQGGPRFFVFGVPLKWMLRLVIECGLLPRAV